jgi:hypothetical protein
MIHDKSKHLRYVVFLLLLSLSSAIFAQSQTPSKRALSGILLTKNNESVAGITLTVNYASGEQSAITGEDGVFQFLIPNEAFTLKIQGKYVVAQKRGYSLTNQTENLVIEIQLVVPQVHESVVIVASQLDPTIDRRNSVIYKDSLFARDDQIFQTLDAASTPDNTKAAANRLRFAGSALI